MRNIILVTFGLLLAAAESGADERKAVFDLRSGDPDRIKERLVNDIKRIATHYESEGHQFKAVVVISGRAYKYFIEDLDNSPYRDEEGLDSVQAWLPSMFKELNDDYDVSFEMCEVGMTDRNIKPETLFPFVVADRLQAIYLIDWQNAGYAYVPVF